MLGTNLNRRRIQNNNFDIKSIRSSWSSFASIDLDEHDKNNKNREMMRKKFGLSPRE